MANVARVNPNDVDLHRTRPFLGIPRGMGCIGGLPRAHRYHSRQRLRGKERCAAVPANEIVHQRGSQDGGRNEPYESASPGLADQNQGDSVVEMAAASVFCGLRAIRTIPIAQYRLTGRRSNMRIAEPQTNTQAARTNIPALLHRSTSQPQNDLSRFSDGPRSIPHSGTTANIF